MIHEACPDCEETLKWSSPTFIYKGKILAGFAAFKAHATFGFWSGSQVLDTDEQAGERDGPVRPADLARRPAAARRRSIALTSKAMTLIDEGVKPPRNKHEKPPFTVPQDLRAAIDANAGGGGRPSTASRRAPSANMSNGSPRRSATRPGPSGSPRRSNGSAEGKRRNWKYENC